MNEGEILRRLLAMVVVGVVAMSTLAGTDDVNAAIADPDIIVVGGTGVISDSVVAHLSNCTAGSVTRVAGADRFATAAEVAKSFSSGGVAFVATGENFPDAVSGGSAAAKLEAPILLVSSSIVPSATKTRLGVLAPTIIYVLGGTGPISESVASELAAYGTVRRLSGSDRYSTAAAVSAEHFSSGVDSVFIAVGDNFPDALAGGPAAAVRAAPMLLVQTDIIPSATRVELLRLNPREIVILGGTGVVAPGVESELRGLADTVNRWSGPDRYSTAAEVSAQSFPGGAPTIYVATGENFPDALAAGPAAGIAGGPVLLTSKDVLPASTAAEIARLTGKACSAPPPPMNFGSGTWIVGSDVSAATYRNSDSSGGCYWERLSGLGGDFDDIIANDFTFEVSIVTIKPTDVGFSSSDCGTWSTDLSPRTAAPTASFGPGTFLVGSEVAPTRWRNSVSTETCYWERLSGFSGELDDVLANSLSDDISIVDIATGDIGFLSERCGTWSTDLSPRTASPTADFAGGSYLVGSEIASGIWRNSDSASGCYWERRSGFSGTTDDVIANDFSFDIETVEIFATDIGFESSDCGTWTKIG